MIKFGWIMKACGVFLLWAAAAVALPGQTFTTLLSFDLTNGAYPQAGQVQGTDGNFYGTTAGGGANDEGTVFKITPSGTLTTLYSFCSLSNCMDGEYPTATLIQATDGSFYGTTQEGGAGDFCTSRYGCGTVFKMTPSGILTTPYSFCSESDCADGAFPYAGVVQATNGDFYGTTFMGGANLGYGTVFKITPSGTLTTLHSFHSTDGESPTGLIQAADGNFYGTTVSGGADPLFGTVFKMTPSGAVTTLHSFDYEDGAAPFGGLVQATDGDFYGTTSDGGPDYGTVFKITPSGTLTTLHSFIGTDGWDSVAALIQGTNGEFYGTTEYGGATDLCIGGDYEGYGVVFSLNVGLGQFVETLPISGKVGAHIKILGSFLTGATSVTFNGTPATFTIISKSEILTTVPTGATTGTVQVISPRLGTLSSNVPFTVRP